MMHIEKQELFYKMDSENDEKGDNQDVSQK